MTTTAGDRIRERRTFLRYSQRSLGEKIGVSGPAVSQWENDQTFPEEVLWAKLAEVLECDIKYILHGDDPSQGNRAWDLNVSQVSLPKQNLVPLISFVQAGDWNNDQQHYNGEHEYVQSVFDTGPRGYALQVEGESMMPRYHPKDIIFINPDLAPEVGRRVIASCTNGSTFKELATGDNGQLMLKALNDHWTPRYMPLEPDCHIIGVVVGSIRPE